ncbi:MAG: SGNH/GDSL hydrolase family protein [Cyclobacteriaceae bacterium]|nr:SGNH/GDSL hydrolase family protein [Cyclobacteriaceae bacterium]
MKRLLNTLKLLVIWLIVLVAILEIFLRGADPFHFSVEGSKIKLNINYTERFTHQFRGIPPNPFKVYNDLGFQGPSAADSTGKLRIITVGGSTTNCDLISTPQTWPARLNVLLDSNRFWVNNAGFSGHTTFGHQIMLEDVVGRLRPDYVLFLTGANDRGISEIDKKDGYVLKGDPSSFNFTGKVVYYANQYSRFISTITNLSRAAKARKVINNYQGQYNPEDLVQSEPLPDSDVNKVLDRHRASFVPAYRERVAKLVETARALGIKPVLVTQPILFGDTTDADTKMSLARIRVDRDYSAWLGHPADHIDGLTESRILDLYNDAVRSVAAEKHVTLIDLATEMPKGLAYFYDPIHFTVKGCDTVASIIHQHLTKILY